MRNIKLVLRVVLALVFAVSITGCSNAKNNADEILSDLENVFNLKCKAVLTFNILCIVKSIIANSISKGVSYAK